MHTNLSLLNIFVNFISHFVYTFYTKYHPSTITVKYCVYIIFNTENEVEALLEWKVWRDHK